MAVGRLFEVGPGSPQGVKGERERGCPLFGCTAEPSQTSGAQHGKAQCVWSVVWHYGQYGGCSKEEPVPANTDPRQLEKQEQQQPTYVALSYINRFMTEAARREHPEKLKRKGHPKLSQSLTGSLPRSSNVSTPPRRSSGNLTPPVTPPITPSSSFRSSTPTGRLP
uniref:JAZF zinc finger 1 n=1 Tax=Hucho hucho TaxID=62062 RepID=A0A4W5M5D2_9TELE